MMRRVEAAKTLLNATSTPMTEIALQLGFSEASSLSAGFSSGDGREPECVSPDCWLNYCCCAA